MAGAIKYAIHVSGNATHIGNSSAREERQRPRMDPAKSHIANARVICRLPIPELPTNPIAVAKKNVSSEHISAFLITIWPSLFRVFIEK
jgi:hypothetical protein